MTQEQIQEALRYVGMGWRNHERVEQLAQFLASLAPSTPVAQPEPAQAPQKRKKAD